MIRTCREKSGDVLRVETLWNLTATQERIFVRMRVASEYGAIFALSFC